MLVPRRHVTATCFTLRQLALYNSHLLLFPTAIINGLKYYIYKKGKAPKYINKFNEKGNKIKLVV